jgi:hypothetical protein
MGFTNRFAGAAAQAVLGTRRLGLMENIENVDRAIVAALLATVALVLVHVHHIDFISSVLLGHESHLLWFG